MTTTTIEYTEAEIAHRKACAYLKGYIVAASQNRGMKWEGDPERTPEFKQGYEDGQYVPAPGLTLAHIIYNRLRHQKPHRTSGKHHYDAGHTDFDQSHIAHMRHEWPGMVNKLASQLANYGIDVSEVL